MPLNPEALPRDPDCLIEIVVELEHRNAHLEGMIETLKRAAYGPRSEKLMGDPAQLPLDLNDVVFIRMPAAANDHGAVPPRHQPHAPRPKPSRNIGALPKHLPRYEVTIEPEDKSCPCCGGTMHLIGDNVTEQLDVLPAVLQVKRIHRPRYGCRSCEGCVVQAAAPARLVDNGMATTALVTSIAVAKYAWHPTAASADADVAMPWRRAGSFDPGTLGHASGMVAEATAQAACRHRAGCTQGILR